MKRAAMAIFILAVLAGLCRPAGAAGFTETLPKSTFMLDTAAMISVVNKGWNNDGEAQPLMDDIERYEPGGGLQGVIKPEAEAAYYIWATQIRYGIIDELTAVLALPVVVANTVHPNLQWVSGDYQNQLGRPYSGDDFWQWAQSMGQPRPDDWSGNRWTMSDIILALRWRFSDRAPWFKLHDFHLALQVQGSLPTGTQKDPEEIVAAGTTSWDLHMGEFSIRLGADKLFTRELDGRLQVGFEIFYEALFKHTYQTPRGTIHPLLLNYQPYVGDTYTIDPGDFFGASLEVAGVFWKGPVLDTWLTRKVENRDSLPPLLAGAVGYTFTYLGQSDWESDSEIWDWDQEKFWRPGYKNMLNFNVVISLLRVGAPLQIYGNYRNLSWIPGKNCRAADVYTAGIRLIAKFW